MPMTPVFDNKFAKKTVKDRKKQFFCVVFRTVSGKFREEMHFSVIKNHPAGNIYIIFIPIFYISEKVIFGPPRQGTCKKM